MDTRNWNESTYVDAELDYAKYIRATFGQVLERRGACRSFNLLERTQYFQFMDRCKIQNVTEKRI